MQRRDFLKLGAGFVAHASGLLLPPAVLARAQPEIDLDLSKGARTLDLWRPETGERLRLTYLVNGVWQPHAYRRICWMLRDWQAGRSVQMDVRLIGILDWTQRYLSHYGYRDPLHILSGYRSEKTNARTEGASKDSQHLYGKALDFHIPGLSAAYLGRLMSWLSQGGVGVYYGRQFVHVDTGRLRTWRGR